MSDMMVVSIDKARELVGGDEPVSRSTIERMIRDGALVARGSGRLRRVTVESIDAYNRGETVWQRTDGQKAPARSNTTKPVMTSSHARQTKAGQVVLLPGKMPKAR